MKSFFDLFADSYHELTRRGNIRCIAVTGMLCALSMAIEGFTIEIPFAKINFAYIAIASIGMLFGPVVSFLAGGICDILGYFVHPDGGFLPLYTLIGMLQGLLYGMILYRGSSSKLITNKTKKAQFVIRIICARFADVLIINLLINTAANLHYGFIPAQAYSVAIKARLIKNLLQLCADIPILLILLPVVLEIYRKAFGRRRAAAE